jgi:hypothetical protein
LEATKMSDKEVQDMLDEIIKDYNEFIVMKKTIADKIEKYDALEVEVVFLKLAILVIIYMYISGVIKMA